MWAAREANSVDIGAYEYQTATPAITVQPLGRAVAVGQPTWLAVKASGSPVLHYAWEFQPESGGGFQSVGGDSVALEFASAQPGDAGLYRCTVSNFAGSAVSNAAALQVIEAPVIVAHPADASVAPGDAIQLVTEATGGAPLLFVWKKGDAAVVPGGRVAVATSAGMSTLTVSNAEPSDAGDYACVVSNIAGSAESDTATVHITGPVVILRHPASRNVAEGTTVTLRVAATGTPPLAYGWYRDGTPLGDGGQRRGFRHGQPDAERPDGDRRGGRISVASRIPNRLRASTPTAPC